ncbi:hypothetical protein J1N35_004181 [Gossypium stocksii]|uniref:DUF4283 domain-containing protein n=1 Tax=Gossypium stocksii TaxID=47602 RepID=A0A9D3WBN4_9ROSI|nr:hypothetical protein J1N35_004181 [Gossypium stocksii]
MDFNPAQPYPSIVMEWIRLLGLPRHMYKLQILWEIGGMIRKVAKLDFNMDNDVRGSDKEIGGTWPSHKSVDLDENVQGFSTSTDQSMSIEHMREQRSKEPIGVLDAAKHLVVLFKENIQHRTGGTIQRSRISTKGHPVEFSSARGSVKANGSRKVSNMVKLLQSQFQWGLVNEVLKVMDEKSGE